MQNMIKEALNPSLFSCETIRETGFLGCPCDDKGTYERRNLDARISWDITEPLLLLFYYGYLFSYWVNRRLAKELTIFISRPLRWEQLQET